MSNKNENTRLINQMKNDRNLKKQQQSVFCLARRITFNGRLTKTAFRKEVKAFREKHPHLSQRQAFYGIAY